MSEIERYKYGIRLAIIYAIVWFIDLLDASSLNIALPSIAQSFSIAATDAEWAIVGFLLSMTIGISISGWLGDAYGARPIFLLSQALYMGSSIGCGMSYDLASLVFFRIIQGFAGGMAIPLGMSTLMKTMPQSKWAKTNASMNMVTLIAPALGPIFGAYVTSLLGWRWIFLFKLPLSIFCFLLSVKWIKQNILPVPRKFDWLGFVFGGLALTSLLWTFSEVGKENLTVLLGATGAAIGFGVLFIKAQAYTKAPLVPFSLFKIAHFIYGNLIQSAANTIFLGANFLIALYLQQGLGFDLMTTGWIMAAITPGMLVIQPFVGKYYNRTGPLPFIVSGLILLSASTCAFALATPSTPAPLLALLVFCIGAASSMAQTANVASIFSSIPHNYMGAGSSLYSLFKQISASFGVALSTMVLSIGMTVSEQPTLTIFHLCFLVLGSIPALALVFCRNIDNQRALMAQRLN
ncbi:MAG: MFS transporter [Parachlamydiaceae bacterium]